MSNVLFLSPLDIFYMPFLLIKDKNSLTINLFYYAFLNNGS